MKMKEATKAVVLIVLGWLAATTLCFLISDSGGAAMLILGGLGIIIPIVIVTNED